MAPAYVSLPPNLGSRETKTLMKKPALTIKTSKTTMPKTTTSSKTKSPPPTTWTPSRSSKTDSRRSQVPLTTGLRRGRHRQLAARQKKRHTTLDTGHNRLEKICLDRHIDTRTRKQKTLDKESEQAADDPSRNSSRQRDTTRSTRQGAATRNDRGRQHVDVHENADDAVELATSLGGD